MMRPATMILLSIAASAPPAANKPATSLPNTRTGNALYDQAGDNYRSQKVAQPSNGQLASPGEFPWQVSVGRLDVPDARYAHFCGGTIYSAHWIITAAHCVEHLQPTMIGVVAGTLKLDSSTPRNAVNRLVPMPGYVSFDRGKDIALVHLTSPILLSSNVKPIALVDAGTEAGFVNKSTQFLASGWGASQYGGLALLELMKVPLPFASHATCTSSLSYPPDPTTHKPVILPDMMCAGTISGEANICDGDSGGPLALVMGDHPVLVGVASFTAACAAPYKYGVFSRVSQYRSWILRQTSGG